MKIISLKTSIPLNHQLTLQLPDDIPPGPANLEIHILSEAPQPFVRGTLGNLVQSPLCGIWAGRTDLGDSMAYAQQLRTQAEQRGHG